MRSVLHAHFIPNHKLKKRGELLSHKSLAYYTLCLLLVITFSKTVSRVAPNILGYATNINVTDLLNGTNEERNNKSLNILNLDTDLSKAAYQKALHMFKNDYWAHVAPDGTEPWFFFNEVSYDYSYAGENLAKNFKDSESVVKAWMNSPSHRENMLNKNYTDIGFAVVNGKLNGYDTTLVVQFFGKRRSPKIITKEVKSQLDSVSVAGSKTEKALFVDNSIKDVTTLGNNNFSNLENQKVKSMPIIDLSIFSKVSAIVFAVFFLLLLGIDFWYSAKNGVVKVNGHTLAHISLLFISIISIWFVLTPAGIL